MAIRKEHKAEVEIRQTILLMEWIEAVGRDSNDPRNYSDRSLATAQMWARRNRFHI